jgi:NitT/TauT family transport system substrate-binding protein
MKQRSMSARWRALGAALLTLMVACAAAQPAPTKVRIGIASPMTAWAGAPVFGIKLGLWRDEGLEPEFVAVRGGAVLLPQLVNKTLDFGLPGPDLLIVALDKAEPYPVRLFANHYSMYAFEFVVPAASPIKTLADLKGRKLGVGALTWGNLPVSRAILADAGVTWQKDVQVLPVGLGPAAWQQFSGGAVDALNLFVGEHETMARATGMALRRLPVPERFSTLFSNGIATHNDTLRDKPQLAVGVARAFARSVAACEQAMEACVRAFWEANPATRPAPDQEAKVMAETLPLLKLDLAATRHRQAADRYGDYREADWRTLIQTLHAGGQISKPTLPLAPLYTTELLDRINQWDRAALRARVAAAVK